ncbi:hypothetical protein GOBAR_AA17462 [Gossypium barbadense]|uniref:Uncharacterized protein n=1 Tax=Gossypium barbadense TaxID=3634 RepID=A0A2P5RK56_GOSBA|nr:hypothetical protein GOBAR_DD15882 [Gossypium barbadense]PPS03220.1 hypothetical protein GOBAR_AA17462 [Gossypium barbadense]
MALVRENYYLKSGLNKVAMLQHNCGELWIAPMTWWNKLNERQAAKKMKELAVGPWEEARQTIYKMGVVVDSVAYA